MCSDPFIKDTANIIIIFENSLYGRVLVLAIFEVRAVLVDHASLSRPNVGVLEANDERLWLTEQSLNL
jgi:hypothetical protein